jgi:chemotaxis signal transduction protein
MNAATVQHITDILEYINKLYTVYTRIFVYDHAGKIIASTNPQDINGSIIGSSIDQTTLKHVMSLRSEQEYYVTPFLPNPLYGNAPTYIYHAAIMAPDNSKVVGGVGIVFDSANEFLAMLRGGIVEKASMNAFYIDRQGKIIASTDITRPVGSLLEIDASLLALPNGKSTSRIVTHDGHYSIMGCSVSHGYREFKVIDGYKDDVIAVVFDSFGEVRGNYVSNNNSASIIETFNIDAGGIEFATFFINRGLFAIETEHVLEAIAASEISPVSMGSRSERVGVLAVSHESEGHAYAWVFDLGYLLSGEPTVRDSSSQVIVVKHGHHKVGLLVSALHSVAEFNQNQVTSTPLSNDSRGALIKQIIKANDGRLLIQSVDIEYLLKMLRNPFETVDLTVDSKQSSQILA